MTDEQLCAGMTLGFDPRCSIDSLLELRSLLQMGRGLAVAGLECDEAAVELSHQLAEDVERGEFNRETGVSVKSLNASGGDSTCGAFAPSLANLIDGGVTTVATLGPLPEPWTLVLVLDGPVSPVVYLGGAARAHGVSALR